MGKANHRQVELNTNSKMEKTNYTRKEVEEIISLVFDKVHRSISDFDRASQETAKELSFEYVKDKSGKKLIEAEKYLSHSDLIKRILVRLKDHYPASLYLNETP